VDIIKIDALAIGYHPQQVLLANINQKITGGELICLMGLNGSGKSTLLRTLASLIPPLAGEIALCNQPLGQYSVAERSKLISIVTTERPTLDYLSVEEVVAMGRTPYTNFWGSLGPEDLLSIKQVMSLLSIENLKNRPFSCLSDGMQQLVLIARALVQQGKVVILDEPTTFLDIPNRRLLLKVLQQVAQEQSRAVLFSSHDWELVRKLDPIIWLVDPQAGLLSGKIGDQQIMLAVEKLLFNDH
jgi:iron complex transport system ATP-binding protein